MLKIKSSRAFTLIEILVVVGIIGVLASVILTSTNAAKQKGIMAANKKEAKQLYITLQKEFSDNGSYSNLLVNAWIPNSYSCDTTPISGNYASEYRSICRSIINRLGVVSDTYNMLIGDATGGGGQKISVMIKISPAPGLTGTWYCIGTSGRTYTGAYNTLAPGCYQNP